MAIFNFFKAPKIRQFNYVPRYYDPHKEEYEARKKRILQELAEEKGESEYKPKIRKGFLSEKRKKSSAQRDESIFRYVIYSIVIISLVYFVVLR